MGEDGNHQETLAEPKLASKIWQLLHKYNSASALPSLAEVLAQPGRFGAFSRQTDGLLYDFSRVRIDERALSLLLDLASAAGVAAHRASLFAGEPINVTEGRPAMHMALRTPELERVLCDEDANRLRDTRAGLKKLADVLHTRRLPGGGPVDHIVHVGIGGSLLGSRLVYEALGPGSGPEVHFVGSVDAHHRERLISRLKPGRTAVVLVSKSFSTPDTLLHGRRLRAWLEAALGDRAGERLFAISGSLDRAVSEGVPASQVLDLPDWVGGRYSLWSSVSLSVAAHLGSGVFDELLAGARDMDLHFQQAPKEDNLPVLKALINIWHRSICGYPAQGVIPYDQRLALLPSHLQQVIMESNGKSTTIAGHAVTGPTSPLVFGEIGTDAQHSLFQCFHQGSEVVPLCFVAAARPDHGDLEAHEELLANMLAQAAALAHGRSAQATAQQLGLEPDDPMVSHRSFPGERPTEALLIERLDARHLGRLLALFEHTVFVESVIWGINAFDQWGVELGKTLAGGARDALRGERQADVAISGLVEYLRQERD
ncbi:MAG: glucose-6-phosphate isomerase [Xanthomonadales bacterium]|nr:glucose-6-phosphate isomerase [Xanthomonadales bacterium]